MPLFMTEDRLKEWTISNTTFQENPFFVNVGETDFAKEVQPETFDSDIVENYASIMLQRDSIIKDVTNKLEVKREFFQEQADNRANIIKKDKQDMDIVKKQILILTECSTVMREKARQHFETIITEALKYVTQSEDYEFVIQEKTERNKASYEFYIKTIINGEESLQNPKDANGGGFIDIISVAAKYAYLELFKNPRIKNSSILLDEPGKMIDEQRSIKFAEYIKELGDSYGKQTIMITHNTTLSDVADKTYYVSQGDDLISKVSEIDQVMLESIESQVKEELNED